MPGFTTTVDLSFTVIICSACRVRFGIEDSHSTALHRTRETFYCPNGHSQWFPGKTVEQEAKELRAQLDAARLTQDRLRDEVAHQESVARGYKGALTKTKRRISEGVCPCCNRTFVNLARHMKGQHPDYAETVS